MSGLYHHELYGYQNCACSAIPVNELPTTQPPMTSTDQPSQPPISITVAPITTVGPNTAGMIYSLECSVSVTGSTEQPTITWLDPMNNQITSGVETTGSMSTLTFNPLTASQDGMTYTCRATLGSITQSQAFTVTVNGRLSVWYRMLQCSCLLQLLVFR